MRNQGISQYSEDTVGVAVFESGALTDPTGNAVTLSITRLSGSAQDPSVLATGLVATRDGVGLYSYVIGASFTSVKGAYRITWTYDINGDTRTFTTDYNVVNEQPYWDSLTPAEKQLVDNVYHRVSDSWDSTQGGPYLWELPQTTFGFETIARLMITDAIPYINMTRQPTFNYATYNVAHSPSNPKGQEFPEEWYGLLEKATYWSFLKHIARSYNEVPNYQGVSQAAYIDRSAYQQKWLSEAQREKEELDDMLKWLKRKFIGGYRRSILVGGGFFPSGMFINAARPNWPYVATI